MRQDLDAVEYSNKKNIDYFIRLCLMHLLSLTSATLSKLLLKVADVKLTYRFILWLNARSSYICRC